LQSSTSSSAGATPPQTEAAPLIALDAGIPEQYTKCSRLSGPVTIPRKLAYAVIEAGPTQYRVCQGDVIVTEHLHGVDINDVVSFNRVLMMGSQSKSVIGRPFVPGAHVLAIVEEHFRNAKVIIFKKRRRKNSRRQTGHRQRLTTLRIMEVVGIEAPALPPLGDNKPKPVQPRKKPARKPNPPRPHSESAEAPGLV